MIRATIAIALSLFCSNAAAFDQEDWCSRLAGEAEVVLPDSTRCDCVTETHAIEIEHATDWYEAIGQSLYYAMQTGKKAGIALILASEKDRRYWERLNSTIKHYNLPIETWRLIK